MKILIDLLILLCFASVAVAAPGDTISKSVRVSWDANTESDLAGYRIYHAGSLLKDVPDPLATSFEAVVENLTEGESIFNLTAYDTSGNESFFSNNAILVYDSTAPAVPSNVTIQTTPRTRVTVETWE